MKSQFKPILKLALPVAIAQLGQMLMGVVDIFMVGKLGPAAIGAVSVGNAIFYIFSVGGIGLLLGLDYLISHAFGRKDYEECHFWLVQGFYFTLLLCLILIPPMYWVSRNLAFFGINPDILKDASDYLMLMCFNIWPFILFVAFRQYLSAQNTVTIITILMLFGNGLNALFNWVLIFGHWHAPALGVKGSAFATTITRFVLIVLLIGYTFRRDKKLQLGLSKIKWSPDKKGMKRLLKIGLPSSLQLIFEVAIFSLSSIFAARLGTTPLAAHTIVLQIASMTFMVPLGINIAAAVRVGQFMGQKNLKQARNAGWAAHVIGFVFMATCALIFLIFRKKLGYIFVKDETVVNLCAQIFLFVAAFQIFDGLQTIGTGALRGIGNTSSAMYANFIGHWVIGLSLCYYLGFYKGYGLHGIWFALTLGLAYVAILVVYRWHKETESFVTAKE